MVQEAVLHNKQIEGVEKVVSEKEMHKATCAECGKECEVPFKPDPRGQFIAENALLRNDQQDHQDDIKLTA